MVSRFSKGNSEHSLAYIRTQPWPGNVRELKHAMERACLVAAHPLLRREDFGRTEPQDMTVFQPDFDSRATSPIIPLANGKANGTGRCRSHHRFHREKPKVRWQNIRIENPQSADKNSEVGVIHKSLFLRGPIYMVFRMLSAQMDNILKIVGWWTKNCNYPNRKGAHVDNILKVSCKACTHVITSALLSTECIVYCPPATDYSQRPEKSKWR